MPEGGAAAPKGGSRAPPNAAESLLWNQRVEKEEHYNARQNPKYSVRNCIQVLDVPGKFKPGHIDPTKEDKGLKRFDPAEHGWDPDGEDAREFRRCINSQSAGPRDREPYPMTTAQEHGWLLAQGGNEEARVRRKKCRMGLGWEPKHPSDYSQSTAMPPMVLAGACSSSFGGARGSAVSASTPAIGSAVGAAAPFGASGGDGDGGRSQVSAVAPLNGAAISVLSNSPPSLISRCAPSAVSGVSASSSSLSRATSLPVLGAHPADVLCHRERRIGEAMKESVRFQCSGDRGNRYSRPLGITDATKFEDDFCKAAGMPLYKTIGKFESHLKIHGSIPAPKWR